MEGCFIINHPNLFEVNIWINNWTILCSRKSGLLIYIFFFFFKGRNYIIINHTKLNQRVLKHDYFSSWQLQLLINIKTFLQTKSIITRSLSSIRHILYVPVSETSQTKFSLRSPCSMTCPVQFCKNKIKKTKFYIWENVILFRNGICI